MTTKLRVFISYSTFDKEFAGYVKNALVPLGAEGFLAHEDISVSERWRDSILLELEVMNVFIPLLSANFKQSDWAPQEVGAAALREKDILIIPIRLPNRPLMPSTQPTGFIGSIQAGLFSPDTLEGMLRDAIGRRFPHHLLALLIDKLEESSEWAKAIANFQKLQPYFTSLTPEEAERIALASIGNRQIWDAHACADIYIPDFIAKNRHQLAQAVLEPLEYQIKHRKVFEPEQSDW